MEAFWNTISIHREDPFQGKSCSGLDGLFICGNFSAASGVVLLVPKEGSGV